MLKGPSTARGPCHLNREETGKCTLSILASNLFLDIRSPLFGILITQTSCLHEIEIQLFLETLYDWAQKNGLALNAVIQSLKNDCLLVWNIQLLLTRLGLNCYN